MPATDLAAFFTDDELARMAAHATVQRWGGFASLAVEWSTLFALGFGSAGKRLWVWLSARTASDRTPLLDRVLGTEWRTGLVFAITVALLLTLATLPFDLALDWAYARSVGTSTEGLAHWLRGVVVDTVRLAFGFGAVGLTIDAIRRKFPRSWWVSLGAVGAVVVLGLALVEPYRAEVYFDVTPLPAGPLRTRLEGLLASRGTTVPELVVIDASTLGPGVNAFSTGVGPTRRFILTDTLLAQGDDAVAGAVLHEVGHRREERLPRRLALGGLALFMVLWLVDRLLNFARTRGAPSDAVAVPFVVLVLAVLQFVTTPVSAAFNRDEEREADALELSVRTDRVAYAREVAERAKADLEPPEPDPFDALFATHPSPAERIRTALGR